MNHWTLTTLDATQPGPWLTTLGLLTALPGALLHVDADQRPVLTSEADLDDAVNTVRHTLHRLLDPDDLPWTTTTTSPGWTYLATMASLARTDERIDRLLHTVDVGEPEPGGKDTAPNKDTEKKDAGKENAGQKRGAKKNPSSASKNTALQPPTPVDPDSTDADETDAGGTKPQPAPAGYHSPRADLILIGGRMSATGTLRNLWGIEASAPGTLQREIRALLDPSSTTGNLRSQAEVGFRYSVTEISPRLRGGNPNAWIAPAAELLAFLGVTNLLPRQRGIHPDTGDLVPGMTWTLPAVPMDLTPLLQMHEQRIHPPGWTRCTSSAVPLGKWFREFIHTRILED